VSVKIPQRTVLGFWDELVHALLNLNVWPRHA
jgi:hypothetical protein